MDFVTIFVGIAFFVFGYFIGLNAGYNMERLKDETDKEQILNAVVLFDTDSDFFLAYELVTKKFLTQSKEMTELVGKLQEKFPNHHIVISKGSE